VKRKILKVKAKPKPVKKDELKVLSKTDSLDEMLHLAKEIS
jgi:hypothetical protein